MIRDPISRTVRYKVFRRDGFACQYCGRRAPEVVLHVDHVLPVSLGGGDEESNLKTACSACNLGKSDLLNEQAQKAEESLELENLVVRFLYEGRSIPSILPNTFPLWGYLAQCIAPLLGDDGHDTDLNFLEKAVERLLRLSVFEELFPHDLFTKDELKRKHDNGERYFRYKRGQA